MCLIVFLIARGVAVLVARLADRRRPMPPPDAPGDTLVLAA